MPEYFFDSFAIIEMINKNPNFAKYNEFPLVTTRLNRIELYWWALTRYGQELADILLDSLSYTMDIPDDVIRDGLLLRKNYSQKNLSYIDALGYAFAQKHNLLFLTGDKAFKGLPGVEFVE